MNNRIVFERARQLETLHSFREHIEEDMNTQTRKVRLLKMTYENIKK